MADTLNQVQLSQIVSAVLAALQQGNAAKAAPAAQPVDRLAQKDRALVQGFKRRGITDVVLMDRTDPKKPYNAKPFKAWLQDGRMVTKGQHRIRGLFHISQTSPIAPKSQPKAKPAKAKPQARPAA
jgi:hypothetical protein